MEHIRNIEIKNFKSIRHQKIEDCRRVNVFIGYPNVGKSNILEALGILGINEISKFNLSSFVRFESPALLFFDGDIYENISIKINDSTELLIIPGSPAPLDFYCTTSNKPVNPDLIGTNAEGIIPLYNYSLLPDSKNVTPFKSIEKKREYGIKEIKRYIFEKDVIPEIGNLKTLKHPEGTNIFDIISTNDDIQKSVIDFFRKYDLQFSFDTGTRRFKVLKKLGDKIFLIPYSMIADTLQRIIFYKTAILSNKEAVLLFEEPEAHMFPPYIAQFTTDIIFDDNDNQFFIATHSPFVINDFIEEARGELSVYVVDYDKGETIVKRLTDDEVHEIAQYGIDLFYNLESYLDKYGQPHSA